MPFKEIKQNEIIKIPHLEKTTIFGIENPRSNDINKDRSVRKYQQNYPNEQMKSNIFFNNLKVKSFFIFNKIMIYYFLKKIYCLFL